MLGKTSERDDPQWAERTTCAKAQRHETTWYTLGELQALWCNSMAGTKHVHAGPVGG